MAGVRLQAGTPLGLRIPRGVVDTLGTKVVTPLELVSEMTK